MLSKIFDSLDVQAFCAVKWEKAVASLYAFPWGYTYNSESNGEQYLGGGFGIFISSLLSGPHTNRRDCAWRSWWQWFVFDTFYRYFSFFQCGMSLSRGK